MILVEQYQANGNRLQRVLGLGVMLVFHASESQVVIYPGPFRAVAWTNWQPGDVAGTSFQPGAVASDSFQPRDAAGDNL